MTLASEGAKAPPFSAKDERGKTWKLADLKGRPVVLYFYPTDDTPGCTKEACGFRDASKELSHLGLVVLGVSRQDEASHSKFKSKYNLNFPLLVDTDGKVSEAYGTWTEKSMYGRTYMGMQRATFLIDGAGRLAKVWPKVTPAGHAEEVLEAARALKESARSV